MELATDEQAAALTAKLLGCFPISTESLEFFPAELEKKFSHYSAEAGVRAIDNLIGTMNRLPSVARLTEELVICHRMINRKGRPIAPDRTLPEHRPFERTPEGWDAPGVRNRAALAGMMRLVANAVAAHDLEAHERIATVKASPESWPTFLDTHGDEQWKEQVDG